MIEIDDLDDWDDHTNFQKKHKKNLCANTKIMVPWSTTKEKQWKSTAHKKVSSTKLGFKLPNRFQISKEMSKDTLEQEREVGGQWWSTTYMYM